MSCEEPQSLKQGNEMASTVYHQRPSAPLAWKELERCRLQAETLLEATAERLERRFLKENTMLGVKMSPTGA
jgi:hypothetical protein